MTEITHLSALEILDSRGRPTVSASCGLDGSTPASASVPSGASTGQAEALELRDGDLRRFRGLGCRKAVANIDREIAGALIGSSIETQADLDETLLALDGSADKSRLGANAILAVSLAFARANALARQVPLYSYFTGLLPAGFLPEGAGTIPRPTINLFSGGKHAGGQVAIQDVLLVPASAESMADALAVAYEVYQSAARLNSEQYGSRALTADEGGLAPPFVDAEAMLRDAVAAIEAAGYLPGEDVALAVDVAASHFYSAGEYLLDGRRVDAQAMIDTVAGWVERYPIISVEDGLAEDDWANWPRLRSRLTGSAWTLGDDLLCTQPARIARAGEAQAADALLLKVNQVGTVSEAARAYSAARALGWRVTVSARSGETEDDWLADLAVGWSGDQIKIGSITRSERLAKYNRLLAIEAETGWPLAQGGVPIDTPT